MKKILFVTASFFILSVVQAQDAEVIATGGNYGEIIVRDGVLYEGGLEASVVTYDLMSTSFPATTIATGPGTNPHLRFALDDTQSAVYISEFDGPIYAADVTDSNLTLIAQGSTTGGEVLGIAIAGNEVYYSTSAPQIVRFARNDPDMTQEVFFDPANVLPIFNLIIEGDTLYYTTQSDFNDPIEYQVFSLDITSANPSPVLVTTTPERGWTLAVEANFLYIGSDQNNTVYLKDLTDTQPTEATLLRTLELPADTNLYSLDIEDDFFYFTARGNASGIFRIALENLSVATVSNKQLSIFPNPVTHKLYVTGLDQAQEYALYALDGRLLKQATVAPNEFISVEELTTGIYLLKTANDTVIRIIKR